MRRFFVIIAAICLTSCASLQKDMIVSSDLFAQTEDIIELEEKLSALDASVLQDKNAYLRKDFSSDCSALLSSINEQLQINGVQKETAARLYALAGRVYLLQNKKSKAQDYYKLSHNASKGDSQGIILGSRLGIVDNLNDENLISGASENSLIILERGLSQYKNANFTECVALLDTAFIDLPEFYREHYGPVRENAWRLKTIDDSSQDNKIISLLQKSQITVGQMLLITQDSSDYLFRQNAGKKLSENDLYSRVVKDGLLLPLSSEEPVSVKLDVPQKNQLVTRVLSARFLWNLYVLEKSLGDKSNLYSKMMRLGGESPIQDVPLDSKDFDAILGCVENEIISLSDGINFSPEEIPTAAQFLEFLRRL
ncbi:MAG: hypothetical protein MJ176_05520 [Treponema sp.]|nr:hypothetical protein [Treponema sp.]